MPSFSPAEDTATWGQLRKPVVQPMYESRPDPEVIFDLAQRLGVGAHFSDGDMEAAFNTQLAPSGLTAQQLRASRIGMRSEARTRYQKYAEIDPKTGQPRGFQTPTRKVEVYATTFARAGYAPPTVSTLSFRDGEWPVLETVMGKARVKAKLNAFLHPRVVSTQPGWWQGCQALAIPGYDPFGPDGANATSLSPTMPLTPSVARFCIAS